MSIDNCLWCGKKLNKERNNARFCPRTDNCNCSIYYYNHKCSYLEWQFRKKKNKNVPKAKKPKVKYTTIDLGCNCEYCNNPATLFFQTIPYCRECRKNMFNINTKEEAK